MTRNVLFVCFANIKLSPTAEQEFGSMLKEAGYSVRGCECTKGYDVDVKSAGIDADIDRRQMTKPLGDWATEIYAMDGMVYNSLVRRFNQPDHKVMNLEIPDIYGAFEPDLRKELRRRLEPYVHESFVKEPPRFRF
jgi:predicted protein tyrosine phosphatase